MLKDLLVKGKSPQELSLGTVRQKFVAAIERFETGDIKKSEGLSAVFTLQGFGPTRARITNGRISIKSKDFGKTFTRDEAGLDKVFFYDNKSAFSRAIDALDPKDVFFKTHKEEQRDTIKDHLTELPARLEASFLSDLEKRDLYDANERNLRSCFRSSYRDKDFININMHIDKDLNIILEDTARAANGKRVIKLDYDVEENVYSLQTSVSIDRTIEILNGFVEKLENHYKKPLRVSSVSEGEQLGTAFNTFEHDFFVTNEGRRRASQQEAETVLGIKEI